MGIPMKTIPGYENTHPGIQVATKMQGDFTLNAAGNMVPDAEGVAFLKQIGVEWVMVAGTQVPLHTAEGYRKVKQALAEHGLKTYLIGNLGLHNMPEVTLNLPGRDEKIAAYLQYIKNLGAAGIHYTTYAHMGNGIWRNKQTAPVRGGAMATGLDFSKPHEAVWFGPYQQDVLSHGREFTEEELWENYEYFIKQVAPVAEEAGVYIGIHPDDPPLCTIGGVPRSIFGTFAGYKKAIEIANSPNIGVCLCVGCWLEGGAEAMGGSVEEVIRYFAEKKKLFKIHLRNVTGTLETGFYETYPDAGYYNLINVIEALDTAGFDGAVMNDHLVEMVGGHYAAEATFTSYIKGAVDAVQNHLNR